MPTARADFPDLKIEWSPTTGPDDTPSWVDITQYVSSGKTKRGRQYEIDRFQTGELTLEMKTKTRLFDPENTASTYYPNIVPMRQLRITAVWNSVTYPVFYGFVTDWGQTTPGDKAFFTTITVKDAFERFDQIQLPSSAWALEVTADIGAVSAFGTSHWFRLGESDTVRVTDSSGQGSYGIFDNCHQGQPGLVVNDADRAVTFDHSSSERVSIQNPALISGYPFTISCMFQIDSVDDADSKYLWLATQNPAIQSRAGTWCFMHSSLGSNTPGTITAAVYDTTGANYRYINFSAKPWDDGKPHLLHYVVEDDTFHFGYIDGVDVTDAHTGGSGTPVWPGPFPNGYSIGNVYDIGIVSYLGWGADEGGDSTKSHPGTIDEFCVYGYSLSPTRITAQAAAAFGWTGDTTGARFTRFLDAIGWSATARDIQTGVSVLGPANWSAGASALSVMQAWADTETGLFLMSADNKVTVKSRHSPLLDSSSTTSQATFSDRTGNRYLTVDLPRDAALIRNPVTAARREGVSVTIEDATGTAKYGPRNWTAPTSEDSLDSVVYDRAAWLLARYKELGTRLASMVIAPRKDPTNLWPQVLGRLIGERITVKRTPLGLNSEISKDFIIEGVEHSFDFNRNWTTTFVGAPVDPNTANYLILDDATKGLLGGSGAFTVAAATDVFTITTAVGGIANDTPVVLSSLTGAAGVTAGPTYYVVSSTGTAGTFKLAATLGGAAINITSDGSGGIIVLVGQLLAY